MITLTIFTLYIAIVMTGIFGRIPCSCGGILKNMSYATHLLFNVFFIALSHIGLVLENNWKINNRWFYFKKERRLLDNLMKQPKQD
ncbi:MauE/DoxX family redox-associated membrane protein [Pedobacter sp. UYP30]|uniref:MauE/DoxX family redox-associated membrane protein n=1 Tax=Pedobacter sp. UYP30 TaxID=1756400 RepID=UPI00339117D3